MDNKNQDKVTGSSLLISSGTMISRVLGLVREIGMAALFGTTLFADAFLAAFRIPNILRRLFAEGAFFAAFIPKYTEKLVEEDKDSALNFASATTISLFVVTFVVSILGIILAPYIISLYTFGWKDDPKKFQLTITLTRLLFPYIIFMAFSSIMRGILNSHKKFFLPAVSPAFLNIFWISGLGVAFYTSQQKLGLQIVIVSIFILFGGLAQGLAQFPSVRKLGYKIRFNLTKMWSDIKEMVKLMVPGMFGLAVAQVNFLVDLMLASLLQNGSVAALQYANRLILMPLGVLGTSVATATLPTLSETRVSEGTEELARISCYTLRLIFSMLIPIAILTMVLRVEVVQLLFQRGNFTASKSTPMTAFALLFYAFGLPAFGGVKGAVQTFYSMKDTKTPVKIAAVAMLLNAGLNVLLMGPLNHGGLALASAISSTINFLLLLYFFRKRLSAFNFKKLAKGFFKILFASLLAASLVHFLVLPSIKQMFPNNKLFFSKLARFFIPAIAGLLAFYVLSRIFKIDEIKKIKTIFINKFSQKNEE